MLSRNWHILNADQVLIQQEANSPWCLCMGVCVHALMGYICAVQHVVLMREVMRGQAQVVATILFCSGSSGYN